MSARQPLTRSSDGSGEALAGALALALPASDPAGDAEVSMADGATDRWARRGTGAPQPPSSAETMTKVLPSRTNRDTSARRVGAVDGEACLGNRGRSADRPKRDAGVFLIDRERPDEPAVGLGEGLAGPAVNGNSGGRQDQPIGAPIGR